MQVGLKVEPRQALVGSASVIAHVVDAEADGLAGARTVHLCLDCTGTGWWLKNCSR